MKHKYNKIIPYLLIIEEEINPSTNQFPGRQQIGIVVSYVFYCYS